MMINLRFSTFTLAFLLCPLAVSSPAGADILVCFAKGTDSATVSSVSREIGQMSGLAVRGVTAVDLVAVDELGQPSEEVFSSLEKARTAYKNLEFETADKALEDTWRQCFAETSLEFCKNVLFEVNLLKGAIFMTQGDKIASGQAFRTAHAMAPSKVVDPRIFPPKIVQAFNRACAGSDPRPVTISVDPPQAQLRVDGQLVDGLKPIMLIPANHVIEVVMEGYGPTREQLEVLPGSEQLTHSITILPLDETLAWQQLRRIISLPDPELSKPDVAKLLTRFAIEHLIVFHDTKNMQFYTSGKSSSVMLPEYKSESFEGALRRSLGVEDKQPDVQLPPPIAELDDPNELDDEEESSSIRHDIPSSGENSEQKTDFKKVVRSPWFWVSVGVVVLVVGGVVIGTQVGQ